MDLIISSGGGMQTADYIDDNLAFLTTLALGHALPMAYHDKRALSPALREQLIRQIEAERAGSALVTVATEPDLA